VLSAAVAPVAVGVIAVAGVVAVGAWAYENRHEIAHAAERAGGTVVGGAKRLWHGLFG
jgi:hypothetical protein